MYVCDTETQELLSVDRGESQDRLVRVASRGPTLWALPAGLLGSLVLDAMRSERRLRACVAVRAGHYARPLHPGFIHAAAQRQNRLQVVSCQSSSSYRMIVMVHLAV